MDVEGIFAFLISLALASGKFEVVKGSEFKNAPGNGVTGAFWFTALKPLAEDSGLAATSMRFVLTMRIYMPAVSEPSDDIDPQMIAAASAMLAAITGGFTLGGLVRNVDLLGEFGDPLEALPGWLTFGQAKLRTVDITIPMILNNVYDQAA